MIHNTTIYINASWSIEKVLTEPVRQRAKGYRQSTKMNGGVDNEAD